MNISCPVKMFTILFAVMVFLASISCAPSYNNNPEYDNNLREILEMLMQKDASMEDRLGMHQVSRKSNRSPQLRLRFGKRPDASFPVNPPEGQRVQLRLRFGKRDSANDDSIEVPAYLGGLSEMDN